MVTQTFRFSPSVIVLPSGVFNNAQSSLKYLLNCFINYLVFFFFSSVPAALFVVDDNISCAKVLGKLVFSPQ